MSRSLWQTPNELLVLKKLGVIEQPTSTDNEESSLVPSDPTEEASVGESSADELDDDDGGRISIDRDLLLKTHKRKKMETAPKSGLMAKSLFSGLLYLASGLCISLIGPTLPDLQYLTGTRSFSLVVIIVSASALGLIAGIAVGDGLFRCLSPRKVLSMCLVVAGFLFTFVPYCDSLHKCCILMITQGVFLGLVEKGVFSMFHSWRSQRFVVTMLYFSFAFGASMSPFLASQFVYRSHQAPAGSLTTFAATSLQTDASASLLRLVKRSAEFGQSLINDTVTLDHDNSSVPNGQQFSVAGNFTETNATVCHNGTCAAATTAKVKITKPKVADGASLEAAPSYAEKKQNALKQQKAEEAKETQEKAKLKNAAIATTKSSKPKAQNETFYDWTNSTGDNGTVDILPATAASMTTTVAATTTKTPATTPETTRATTEAATLPATTRTTVTSLLSSSTSRTPATTDRPTVTPAESGGVLEKWQRKLWAFVMWAVSQYNNAYTAYLIVSLLTVAMAVITTLVCCCRGSVLGGEPDQDSPDTDLVLSWQEFVEFRSHQCTLLFVVLLAALVSSIEALVSNLLTVYTIVGLRDSQYSGAVMTGTFFMAVAAARLLVMPLMKFSTRIIAVNLVLVLVFASILVFSAEIMSFWLEITAVGLLVGSLLPNIFCWLHDQVALLPGFTSVWLVACHIGRLFVPVAVVSVMEGHSPRGFKLAVLVLALLACLSFTALNRLAKQSGRLSVVRRLAFEMNGNAAQFLNEFNVADKLDDIFNDRDEFLYFDRSRDLKTTG